MRGDVKITALLVLLIAELTRGNISYNMLNREDPCINLCEKASTTMHGFVYGSFKESSCQRGCRFFNLVDLRYGWESNNLNGTKDACDASCTEAYTDLLDRYICYIGCSFMAKQRVSDLLALFSISMEEGMESNILLVPDIPENDILTDPGLRKELLPGWWDSDGFKLPQTYIKTVPMDAGTVDYALSSDYSGETEETASGSDWLYALKQIRMPYWDVGGSYLLFAVIALCIALLNLCFCLLPEDPMQNLDADPCKDTLIEASSSPKVALYIPDEAPLYQEPPPKYDQSSGHCEF